VGAGMSHQYVMLFHTADGGATWARLLDPTSGGPQSFEKTGMRFANAQVGWITYNAQGIMDGASFDQTLDGGRTWETQSLPLPDKAQLWPPSSEGQASADGFIACWTASPLPASLQAGRVVVGCNAQRGDAQRTTHFLYETADAGNTWVFLPYPGGPLHFFSDDAGVALGREIFRTEDGGRTWALISSVMWDGQFSFADEQHGWAVARTDDEMALVISEDGGRTWQLLQPIIARRGY